MVEAEIVESIALSTRLLPADSIGGASPSQTKTIEQRFLRARSGSLLADRNNPRRRKKLQSAVPKSASPVEPAPKLIERGPGGR